VLVLTQYRLMEIYHPFLSNTKLEAVGCFMLWWQHSQLLATKHLSVSTTHHILTGEIIEELRNCVTYVQQQVPCVAKVGGWDRVVTLHVQCRHIVCTVL
jgi:hypothetical protein